MNADILVLAAAAMLVTAYLMVGQKALFTAIRLYGAQSLFLAIVAATITISESRPGLWVTAGVTVALKTVAIPWFLMRVIDRIGIHREIEPFLNVPASLLVCVGLTIVGYRVSTGFPEGAGGVSHHLIGVALSMLLIGLFLMVTRKKAITQILALHTWKPDAYREAPSPAVVLMAVGMLNGALYCILRIHLISKAALGPEFSGGLLLTLGLLSVLVAVPFVLIQWNLKRLLAYSSIEHVGIMAIGVGLGAEAAVFGALLHMTYHSLAKPVALFSAGTLAQLHSSSDFGRIQNGTLTRTPVASTLLVLAVLITTGSPPFGMFFSELTILRAGFAGAHQTATSMLLAALVVLFCGFAFQVGRIVLGPPRDPADRRKPLPERFDLGMATVIVAAILAVASSFYLPGPLLALISAATAVVWGSA